MRRRTGARPRIGVLDRAGARRRLATAFAALVLVAATGCAAITPSAPNPFGDARFVSTAGTRDGHPVDWLASDPLTVTFERPSGTLLAAVSTPCNALSVPVDVQGSRLVPDVSNSASTAMGCDTTSAGREQESNAFFGRTLTYTLSGDRLVLASGSERIEFREMT